MTPAPAGMLPAMKRTFAVLAACGALLFVAPPAAAKSYTLPNANIAVRVLPDGSVAIDEDITFAYDGSFSGAYRDIPARFGERVDPASVAVSEKDFAYS